MCVQRFDDSHNSAIHITYRISLRSSSLQEPRYPLLRVVFYFFKKLYVYTINDNVLFNKIILVKKRKIIYYLDVYIFFKSIF